MKEDNDKPQKTLKIKTENIFVYPSLLTTVLRNSNVHPHKTGEILGLTLSTQIIKTQLNGKKSKLINSSE